MPVALPSGGNGYRQRPWPPSGPSAKPQPLPPREKGWQHSCRMARLHTDYVLSSRDEGRAGATASSFVFRPGAPGRGSLAAALACRCVHRLSQEAAGSLEILGREHAPRQANVVAAGAIGEERCARYIANSAARGLLRQPRRIDIRCQPEPQEEATVWQVPLGLERVARREACVEPTHQRIALGAVDADEPLHMLIVVGAQPERRQLVGEGTCPAVELQAI